MEDKINQGYRLFVEHNPEKQELVGVYMRRTGGATTKVRTGKQELDFFKILPSTKNQIELGAILEIETTELTRSRYEGVLNDCNIFSCSRFICCTLFMVCSSRSPSFLESW